MLTVRERGLDEENKELRRRLAELEGHSGDDDGDEAEEEPSDEEGGRG
jgi:hypothetical protein